MNITSQVRNILRASRTARNSDKELQIIYMQKFGMNLSDAQIDKFKSMPSLETVRRVRQKIQERGEFPADPEVDSIRFKKYKMMRGNVGISTPEEAEHYLDKLGLRIVED